MKDEKARRLKDARKSAGYDSASDAASAFNWGESGYRHHENGTRDFGADAAKKYARAFRVKAGWLLCIDGINNGPVTTFEASQKLTVGAFVAAGVWHEPNEHFGKVEIDTPAPVENVSRLGFIVEGYSMDLHYEPGTVLDCISIFTNGVDPEPGDHVIVERVRPDGLRERTVKEFNRRGGRYYLTPKSSKPEFQSEIEIGSPSSEMLDGGEEVRVIAFVVSAISPRALRLLERMGRVNEL